MEVAMEANGNSRVTTASREATKFYIATRSGSAVGCGVIAAVLLTLRLWGVGDNWLVVVGFPLAAWIACDAVARATRRLDAHCCYLEQLCSDLDRRVSQS